jgi:hypothetical protein
MILVHPQDVPAESPKYRPDTFESLDGITPPMHRALLRYHRKTGITPRTIAVAESELVAQMKGENEVIEELDEHGLTIAEADEAAEMAEAARKAALAAAGGGAQASSSSAVADDGFRRPTTPPPTPVPVRSTTAGKFKVRDEDCACVRARARHVNRHPRPLH